MSLQAPELVSLQDAGLRGTDVPVYSRLDWVPSKTLHSADWSHSHTASKKRDVLLTQSATCSTNPLCFLSSHK